MFLLRWLSIPLLILAFTAGPVYWAFPEGLSAARSLGIVLGWAGCGLLLASLLLMLRETWLSRWLGGLERMYQWHHRTGRWSDAFGAPVGVHQQGERTGLRGLMH